MEIKNECNIISDLLLGYTDGTLTEASKDLVTRHIQNCKECKEKLNNIIKDIEDDRIDNQDVEIDYLKNVKKKITNKNKLIVVIMILLIAVIGLNTMVCINYNINANEMEIFLKDDITEEELKQIENAILKEDSTAKITYISKEVECKEAIESFVKTGYNEAVENINIDEIVSQFPASYKVKADIKQIENIENAIVLLNGIRTIRSSKSLNPYGFLISELLK